VAVVAIVVVACGVPGDYDGDGKADVVWMTSNGDWFQQGKTDPIFQPGVSTSMPPDSSGPNLAVPGDYDGDGHWEPAVVQNGGTWITAGSRGTFSFPAPPNTTDTPLTNVAPPQVIPVPADYDGDGKTDAAWYRESDATWWIEGQAEPIQFGIPWINTPWKMGAYDVPVPADYDGDGKADLAVYTPDAATFNIRGQGDPIHVGLPDSYPTAADFNGDGKAEPAAFEMTTTAPGVTPYGPPAFAFADGSVVPLPFFNVWDPPMPLPANYDGHAGDEPAAYLGGGAGADWIAGQGTFTILNQIPVAEPYNMLTAVRLGLGFKCYFERGYFCPA
jgi:hypothetical protein